MASLSRQAVRQVDRWAIEQIHLPGVVLMENAGRQAADVAQQLLAGAQTSVAVVAGCGNNGGDGFVLARHLSLRRIEVAVYVVAPRQKLSPDAAVNFQALLALNVPVTDVLPEDMPGLADRLRQAMVVVDAVGGTGITGDLRGQAAEAVRQINAAGRSVLAVDTPTGLDCDSGVAGDPTVRATTTVTFVARKLGFDNPESAAYTGRVVVADIGVPSDRMAD